MFQDTVIMQVNLLFCFPVNVCVCVCFCCWPRLRDLGADLEHFFFWGGNEKFQDLMENHCPPKVQEFFTGNPRIPNSQTKNSVAFFSRDFTNYMINFR